MSEKATWLNLPVEIETGGSPVRVVRAELPGKKLGCWDETNGTITLQVNQHTVGEHIILIHEALHAAESVMLANGDIKRRMPETFITGAGYCLALLLAGAGALKHISVDDVRNFNEQSEAVDA